MENLQELSRALMIGSSNGGSISETVLSDLAKAGLQIPQEGKEAAGLMLAAAAAYSGLMKAGLALPQAPTSGAEKLDLPELALAPAHFSQPLLFILKNNHEEILPEFVRLFPSDQYRLPDWLLPDLLNYGVQNPALQAEVAELLGARGVWLAQFRPEWAYVFLHKVDCSQERIFTHGREAERLAWFKSLRKQQPQAAFERLKLSFAQEKAEQKQQFLRALLPHFSPAEEDFVWACSQDRRKEVRTAAFELLERLENGKLQPMLSELLSEWVQLSPDKQLLRVELPEKLNPAAERCHIRPQLHQIEGGEKSSWLLQLFAKIHPLRLVSDWGLPIREILQLMLKSDWRQPLLCGVWLSAAKFAQQDWLLALHRLYLETHQQRYWQSFPAQQLPAGLDEESFNKVIGWHSADAKNGFSDAHPLINLLSNAERWGELPSWAVVEIIDEHSNKDNYAMYYGLRALLQRAAYAADPAIYPRVKQLWEQPSEHKAYNWIKDFREFLSVLSVRAQLLELKK